ncbi:SnoaL-like domain-containing protein [Neolewinella persica]|uniref:SnoaL-like domain-containing protein n=1 Tax=Neolewinella persica TaxID=70998 RepID=UPI00037ECB78|nr:SnoaL-like domain-containing protein [Neolewinella persica]
MTTQQVADRLVALLREAKFNEVYDELFHLTEVVHDEPQSEHFPRVVGVEAIKAKDTQMQAGIAEFLGMEVGEAIVAKNFFSILYKMSVELQDGNVLNLDELIVYEVRDGKVVLEKFFY